MHEAQHVHARRANRVRILSAAASGALLAASAQAQTTSYTYDALGRLTSAASPNGSKASYNYDPADNRTQLSRVAHNRAIASPHDFNADGHSDLWWRHQTSGEITVWRITGDAGSYQEHPNTYGFNGVPTEWQRQATIDFDGDGASDLLWRNPVSGHFSIWKSNGSGFDANSYYNSTVSTSWRVSGVGDYNGDGRTDLFWRHSDGRYWEWRSTGTEFAANVSTSYVDPSWRVVGEGDFDGDGRTDLLWRHVGGGFSVWRSANGPAFDGHVGADWHIAAVGDFSGDGKADLLWRHDNGALRGWRSTGTGFAPNVFGDDGVPSSWRILRLADFNADGKADILWRHDTGPYTVWQSTGSSFQSHVIYNATIPPEWVLFGHQYDVV